MAGVNDKGQVAALTYDADRKAHERWKEGGSKVFVGDVKFKGILYGINEDARFYYRKPTNVKEWTIFDFKHCTTKSVQPDIIVCHSGTSTPVLHQVV